MFNRVFLVAAAAILATNIAGAQTAAGVCKLTNVKENAALYDGACTIHQSKSGKNDVFEITMGSAEPFLFAGSGDLWMHGPEKVDFQDLGGGAIFRWGDFALAATVDTGSSSGTASGRATLAQVEHTCISRVAERAQFDASKVRVTDSTGSSEGTAVFLDADGTGWVCRANAAGDITGLEFQD